MTHGFVIRPVRGRAERAAFVNLPFRLYRDDPCWVPPLKSEVRSFLDRERHPFYDGGEGAEAEFFVAWEGRHPAGRIAAILNHAHNRTHGELVGCFGFLEVCNRPDMARDLLDVAEQWLRERGATAILGPFNPSTNYECGLLVKGFTGAPVIMMTYNPEYYPRLVESAGYTKAKDLLAYISPVQGRSLDRLQRLAERTRSRMPELETRAVNMDRFDDEVRTVQEIYNAAWADNWGFVPMNEGEIRLMAKHLKPAVEPELVRFAFVDGKPAGFFLALPDWNPVIRQFNGSLLRHPLTALRHHFFTKSTDMEGLRLITLGIAHEYRKRGIEGVLFAEALSAGLKLGYAWAEYSWILEDNELTKRAVRLMDGEHYRTYRIYQKPLV
jgi:GNAT superfamily N-acetyltransferase